MGDASEEFETAEVLEGTMVENFSEGQSSLIKMIFILIKRVDCQNFLIVD